MTVMKEKTFVQAENPTSHGRNLNPRSAAPNPPASPNEEGATWEEGYRDAVRRLFELCLQEQ